MSQYIQQQRALGNFPAVLRYERCGPSDLRTLIKHLNPEVRKKLRHVDASRVNLNTVPHGSVAALEDLFRQTDDMAKHNMDSQALGHRRSKHPGRARAVKAAGPKAPWDRKAQPWRQSILTVHHEYFLADLNCPSERSREYLSADGVMLRVDTAKEKRFEEAVVKWQKEEHGDAFVAAFGHLDEQGYHIHSIIAHQSETTTKGHPMGRYLWKPSEHRFFRNELDQKGRRARSGYEVAQDTIGEFFNRPEYRDMKIVRGESRAAKCRQAIKMADDLVDEADLEGFIGKAERLPEGSKNAQAMWVLKRRAEDIEAGRSASPLKPNDERREIAFDILELIGALEPARRNEHATRRAKQQLLKEMEGDYGTLEEILRKPDAAIAKAAADAAIERAKLDEAAARRRAEEDRKAAEGRAAMQAQIEVRETALKERETMVASREKEVEVKEAGLQRFARQLGELRDKLFDAARNAGLLKHPAMIKAFEFAEKILPARKDAGKDQERQ